jgi:predicted MFS family arabinose efflux permease
LASRIVLATYLTGLGFSPIQVGAIITGTLLGSAAVTLGVGLLGYRLSRRRILLGSAALMLLTGIGFAGLTTFWPMMVAALFSLDSFGGGFVVQTLLVLWLHRRFQLDQRTTAGVFFVAGVLSAFSQVLSPRVAARIGLVRTMVYTHLPANVFLILAALMPTAPLSITCLLLRMAVSQMDVPARQAFVMAIVPPEERAAAASVTNVPRSLAAGLAPLVAGVLLERTNFGWPLVIGGALKAWYDLALLVQFRAVQTREAGVR